MQKLKIIFTVLSVLFIMAIPQVASADSVIVSLKHNNNVPQDGPKKGQNTTTDKIDSTIFIDVYKAVLGFEVQHLMAQSVDYYQTRYTLLAGLKGFPVSWVGGYLMDGTKEYCHSGIYYNGVPFGKIVGFIDSQVYWKIDGKSPGYWDTYVSAYWKFEKLQTGPDFGYDYWFEGVKHQFFLYGLSIRYPINDRVLAGVRVVNMNDRLEGVSTNTASTRLYVNFSF